MGLTLSYQQEKIMLKQIALCSAVIITCISKHALCETSTIDEVINRGTQCNQDKSLQHYVNDLCTQPPSIHSDVEVEDKKCRQMQQQQQDQQPNSTIISQTLNKSCGCLEYDTSQSGRIAYLITLHNKRTLEDSINLLKSLIAPGFIVLIHIDKKLPKEEFQKSELKKFIDKDDSCNHCGADIFVDTVYGESQEEFDYFDNRPFFKSYSYFSCK